MNICMRKKILIATSVKERLILEKDLASILDEGGELLLVTTQEEGLNVLHKEKPSLIFVDESLTGKNLDLWNQEGSLLVIITDKKNASQYSVMTLVRPIDSNRVTEICNALWTTRENALLPPM